MKVQFDHQLMSSFKEWFEYQLLNKGSCYNNHSSEFFDIRDSYNGLHTFSAPQKNFVYDSSLSGPNIMSGVYVGEAFITVGTSGLIGIDYQEGNVYFSSPPPDTVSGDYCVKEISVQFSNKPEEELLFETKYALNDIATTGLADNVEVYPAAFLINNYSNNDEFSFGGQDKTIFEIRAVIAADSNFMADGITSIFRDTNRKYVPLMSEDEFPLNVYGDLRAEQFNYQTGILSKPPTSGVYIHRVNVSRVRNANLDEVTNDNPEVFPVVIDFELHEYRYPRL